MASEIERRTGPLSLIAALPDVRSADTWMRPVAWRASGQALVQRDGRLLRVPGFRGAYPWVDPCVSELVSEWEAVSADEVLGERREASDG